MAFTVIIPGRKTPYNCNSFLKARAKYNVSPLNTVLRNNKTRASVRKYH